MARRAPNVALGWAYFHQIGYHVAGQHETRAQRTGNVRTYVRILCGELNLEQAGRHAVA